MQNLRRLDEGLWSVDLPHSLMGIDLGARSTIVRLPSGGLFLCSPGPFEEADFQAIEALGKVEAIVAPNTFHHLYLKRAVERFPAATVFLAPGLKEKVPALPRGEELAGDAPARWSGVLEQLRIEGTTTNEFVFFHPQTRSLILTDLAFNIRNGGVWTRVGMALNGGFGRFGPTRVMRSSIRDSVAFERSLERIGRWNFDRILVAHGEVVERGGRETFARAFGIEAAA